MKKIIDKIKSTTKKVEPKVVISRPKKSVDEWDKDNRSLTILMECLRNMENRDK